MEVVGIRSTSSRQELEALPARVDFLRQHCPLTPDTCGVLEGAELRLTKRGAYLVNCARGPIILQETREVSLDEGRLGGVGLDVFWEEPWDPAAPLFGRADTVTMSHVTGFTVGVLARVANLVAENIRRLLVGEEVLDRIVWPAAGDGR